MEQVQPVLAKDKPPLTSPTQDIDSPQEDDVKLSPLEQYRMKALSDSSILLQGTNGIEFDRQVSIDVDANANDLLEDRHVGVVVGSSQMNEENKLSVTVAFNYAPKKWYAFRNALES